MPISRFSEPQIHQFVENLPAELIWAENDDNPQWEVLSSGFITAQLQLAAQRNRQDRQQPHS